MRDTNRYERHNGYIDHASVPVLSDPGLEKKLILPSQLLPRFDNFALPRWKRFPNHAGTHELSVAREL